MKEIVPIKSMNSQIILPGSKYIANRVIMLAALADGISKIHNVPQNEDIHALIRALEEFGIKIEKEKDFMKIYGGKLSVPKKDIDVRNSGTLMRFITGVAALVNGNVHITGSDRIKERPINDLLASLKDLGIDSSSVKGYAPFTIYGGSLNGGRTTIRGDISSQFISSLLMVAPHAKERIEILIENELTSKNYVDMTLDVMKRFGVEVKREGYSRFMATPKRYRSIEYDLPGDWSSASYFLAAARMVPGRIRIDKLDMHSQEAKFADVLLKTGGMLRKNSSWIEFSGIQEIMPVDVDMADLPDVVQTLAVVASLADGITRIRNIKHLAAKESNRILDTAQELRKLGIRVETKDDELIIHGGDLHGAKIDSHGDHRMAMSFAILGLKIPGIMIMDPECVNKSFPGFWDKLREIGAEVKDV